MTASGNRVFTEVIKSKRGQQGGPSSSLTVCGVRERAQDTLRGGRPGHAHPGGRPQEEPACGHLVLGPPASRAVGQGSSAVPTAPGHEYTSIRPVLMPLGWSTLRWPILQLPCRLEEGPTGFAMSLLGATGVGGPAARAASTGSYPRPPLLGDSGGKRKRRSQPERWPEALQAKGGGKRKRRTGPQDGN